MTTSQRGWTWEDTNAAAKDLAGNRARFNSFCNFDDDLDASWAILYTHNRDSGLLAESNAAEIEKAMAPFVAADNGDAKEYCSNHGACGWIAGYAIRVYAPSGAVTSAFLAFAALQARLEEHPVLNEEDWLNREYNATLENIQSELRRIDHTYSGSDEDLAGEVYSWLCENEKSAIECIDDQGAYPSDDELQAALVGLGYLIESE